MEPLTNFKHPEFSLAMHQSMQAKHRYTILVIYEDGHLREKLRACLGASHTILEAPRGNEGLQLAAQTLPDLIMTDLSISDLQGESLCFQLKDNEKTSHIPIIILTDRDDSHSRMQGFYLGADDFMTIPFQLLELQIRIQNLIQTRKVLEEKFRRHIAIEFSPVEAQSEDELFLKQVMKVIEENMANPMFGSLEFARQLGLSQTRLYRKLIMLTGYSSNDFIRRIRLKRAADLLHKHAGNVSEVAYRVGFNSLSYFAKCFKQLHQYSPREYARQGCP
ncbi:MAG: DNA-binding response regulator [Cyclobacteriaceae bacterium]|jgi:AraC-like DNA-binding protein|nr:DNA-binding response regulator [Cyclobacteriaceae bacterium]MDH4296848.1 DNA-binding response regulator [Cyclobacteriaceae bacterium]MDH5247586.1 DNA-binding response regulator [Cyclobacteriaceae bacterium]